MRPENTSPRDQHSTDLFTVIAIAIIAYAGVNFCHEILGHCTMAVIVGTKCKFFSSTNIPLATQLPLWKYNIVVVAGSAANFIVGLVCFGFLRAFRTSPPLHYFLWLSMCVNLFLPSTYMAAAPIIKFGDSYILIHDLPGQLFWRSAVFLAGATLCGLSFRLCVIELNRLIGIGGKRARSIAWQLTVPAYVAGGIITIASGLFSPLSFKIAQLEAAGGAFGLTLWLLLLPLTMPGVSANAEHPFVLSRSKGWILVGILIGLIPAVDVKPLSRFGKRP